MNLEFALYTSVTKGTMSPQAILNILAVSKKNNRRHGISGFLHYDRGVVLQYLEGPREALLSRLARITADKRHTDMRIIAEGTIDYRFFPDWSMGELNVHDLIDPHLLRNAAWLDNPPEDDVLCLLDAIAMQAYEVNSYSIQCA